MPPTKASKRLRARSIHSARSAAIGRRPEGPSTRLAHKRLELAAGDLDLAEVVARVGLAVEHDDEGADLGHLAVDERGGAVADHADPQLLSASRGADELAGCRPTDRSSRHVLRESARLTCDLQPTDGVKELVAAERCRRVSSTDVHICTLGGVRLD